MEFSIKQELIDKIQCLDIEQRDVQHFNKAMRIFDFNASCDIDVSKQLVSIKDENGWWHYFVPSNDQVFVKIVCDKAQNQLTLKNTTQQIIKCLTDHEDNIIKVGVCDLVLNFVDPLLFVDVVKDKFQEAKFDRIHQNKDIQHPADQ